MKDPNDNDKVKTYVVAFATLQQQSSDGTFHNLISSYRDKKDGSGYEVLVVQVSSYISCVIVLSCCRFPGLHLTCPPRPQPPRGLGQQPQFCGSHPAHVRQLGKGLCRRPWHSRRQEAPLGAARKAALGGLWRERPPSQVTRVVFVRKWARRGRQRPHRSLSPRTLPACGTVAARALRARRVLFVAALGLLSRWALLVVLCAFAFVLRAPPPSRVLWCFRAPSSAIYFVLYFFFFIIYFFLPPPPEANERPVAASTTKQFQSPHVSPFLNPPFSSSFFSSFRGTCDLRTCASPRPLGHFYAIITAHYHGLARDGAIAVPVGVILLSANRYSSNSLRGRSPISLPPPNPPTLKCASLSRLVCLFSYLFTAVPCPPPRPAPPSQRGADGDPNGREVTKPTFMCPLLKSLILTFFVSPASGGPETCALVQVIAH